MMSEINARPPKAAPTNPNCRAAPKGRADKTTASRGPKGPTTNGVDMQPRKAAPTKQDCHAALWRPRRRSKRRLAAKRPCQQIQNCRAALKGRDNKTSTDDKEHRHTASKAARQEEVRRGAQKQEKEPRGDAPAKQMRRARSSGGDE